MQFSRRYLWSNPPVEVLHVTPALLVVGLHHQLVPDPPDVALGQRLAEVRDVTFLIQIQLSNLGRAIESP